MAESLHTDAELARGIWAGDERVVPDARAKYEADPQLHAYDWMSTLYSFRQRTQYADELIALLPVVLEYAERLEHEMTLQLVNQQIANRANVVASVLLWISDQDIHYNEIQRAWLTGDQIASAGLKVADYSIGEHTPALLALNKADALSDFDPVKPGSRRDALFYLRLARAFAPFVKSPNQRVRVWKGLGWLYLRRKNPIGAWFLARAAAAALKARVPRDVLRKVFSLRG